MAPLFRRVSLVVAIWAGALGICAQTLPSTGSIHGTALDEQGAPLPGVEVKPARRGRAGTGPDGRAGRVPVPVHLTRDVCRDAVPRRLRHGGEPGNRRRAGPQHPAAGHDEARNRHGDGHGLRRARDRPAQDRDRRDLRRKGAPGHSERAQHLGDPVGRPGGRHQPGQRRREHRGPGGAVVEGSHRRHVQPRRRRHHAQRDLSDVLQLRFLSGSPGGHGRLRRFTPQRRRDLQHGDQARDERDPRLRPLLLRPQPLADGEHARGGQPRRRVHQPHERPSRLRRRGGWRGALRPPLALGRLGQEPDRPPEAGSARHGGPAGQRELHARELRCAAGRSACRVELPRALLPPRGPNPGRTGCGHQHGAGVRLQPDSTGPDLQDRRHAGLFLEPDGDGLLFLHGLRTDRDAGRGRRHAGCTSIRTTCSAEAALFRKSIRSSGRAGPPPRSSSRPGACRTSSSSDSGTAYATTEASSSLPGRTGLWRRARRARLHHPGGGRDDAGSAARRLRERHADVRPPDGQRGRPLRLWSGAKRGRVRSRKPGLPGRPSGGPLPGRRGLPDLGREVAAARGRDLRARSESADPSARLVLPVRGPFSRWDRLREPLPRDAGPLLLLDGHEREPPCGSR